MRVEKCARRTTESGATERSKSMPAKGVDLGVKGEAETVVLMSSARIWDLVPVPKRFVFILYKF